MFGWLNWLTTRASWNRRRIPSAEAPAPIDLIATWRWRCGSRASKTLPCAPLPSVRTISNRPIEEETAAASMTLWTQGWFRTRADAHARRQQAATASRCDQALLRPSDLQLEQACL